MNREREQFITSIYQLAAELGSEALQENVNHDRLLRLTALAVQSCLGGIATLMEESIQKPAKEEHFLKFPDLSGA